LGLSKYSLRQRLLIAATLLLLVFLGAIGLGLNNAFKQSVITNAQDTLKNQVLLLIANIEVQDGEIVVPNALTEPRLSQTDSDLFAQVSTPQKGVVWQSHSLLGAEFLSLQSRLGEFNFFEKPFLDKNSLPVSLSEEISNGQSFWVQQHPVYAVSFGAEWETEQGDLPFTVQVAEYTTAYVKRLKRYQRQSATWLAIMGLALLLLLLALLSWALKPLVRVTKQVAEIEQGKRQRFDEDYPAEVSRLTQNLNQLLNFEEQRINRQKDVLGNLAHSLKTPIAVLNGLHYSSEVSVDAKHQLGAMQNIIDYQLQSASAVGRRRFVKPIGISEPTQQIINSLSKLHASKNLQTRFQIDNSVVFYGDHGDWMELAGNLLDNAFKWAASTVTVKVTNKPVGSHRVATQIEVIDDGVGIDEQLKAAILHRGVRLDSQTPGHGLGLHIAKGIVEAYDGELKIEDNTPQGTKFTAFLN